MATRSETTNSISRRDFLRFIPVAAAGSAAVLSGCTTPSARAYENQADQLVNDQVVDTAPPTPISPLARNNVQEIQQPTPQKAANPEVTVPEKTKLLDEIYSEYTSQLAEVKASFLPGHHVNYEIADISSPLTFASSETQYYPGASLNKAAIGFLAIAKYPHYLLDSYISQTDQEAKDIAKFRHYLNQMIQNSHNVESDKLIDFIASDKHTALDELNDGLHQILKFPQKEGQTNGFSDQSPFPQTTRELATPGFDNPISLDTFTNFYKLLNNHQAIENLAASAYQFYGIKEDFATYSANFRFALISLKNLLSLESADGTPTMAEKALKRAKQRHPNAIITMYGKDGSLPAGTFPYRYYIEGVNISMVEGSRHSSIALVYTSGTTLLDDLLDTAFELGHDLLKAS